jgi:hypothetical protein
MDEARFAEASLFLIGLAGLATGIVGVLLPPGRRLEVVVALIAGAGAGLGTLGVIGFFDIAGGDLDHHPGLFFAATVIGFVTVMITLALVWLRRTAHLARGDAPAAVTPGDGSAA